MLDSLRLSMNKWTYVYGFAAAMVAAAAPACGDDATACATGSEGCPCTEGGACDAGLVCLSDLCVMQASTSMPGTTDPATETNSEAGTDSETEGTSNTGGTETQTGTGTTNGPTSDPTSSTTEDIFDVGNSGGDECVPEGCKKIDLLFALDGSGSMTEEIAALSAGQAFTQVVNFIEEVNCGDIDYRIGLTNDNDGGFFVPNGWNGPQPWFDSNDLTPGEMATAFQSASSKILQNFATPTGCEHVLSTAHDLLMSDNTGFVRDDALLVIVLITDVDDYGWYDNINGNDCGLGCQQTGAPVATIYNNLVGLKGDDAEGVATIVVAGDPSINGGLNFCGQPGTCCGGFDCQVFHAERLWEFADLQFMTNGYTSNLCEGAANVPNAINDALTNEIDLACQGFEPPQ